MLDMADVTVFLAALALVFGVAALAGIVSDILCIVHNIQDNWESDGVTEDNDAVR